MNESLEEIMEVIGDEDKVCEVIEVVKVFMGMGFF